VLRAEREGDQSTAAAASPAAAEERDPQQEVGKERDHTDEDGDERHQPNVPVADVRELVGEYALQLPLVHQVQEPGC
jgi:hypothetical protein